MARVVMAHNPRARARPHVMPTDRVGMQRRQCLDQIFVTKLIGHQPDAVGGQFGHRTIGIDDSRQSNIHAVEHGS